MTRSDCIRELLAEYQAQRTRNELELEERIQRAEAMDPEIARLRAENQNLAFETVRRVMSLQDAGQRRQAAEQMKQRGIFNNHEMRRRLKELGLAEDYLQLRYRCPVCRDTGYVGEAPSRFCDCFEARLRVKMYEDGSMAALQEQSFECFDLERFPEENGQRAQMKLARKTCEDYADSFPHTRFLNLLLTGAGGLGKTFLLNCIYGRVLQRGFSAVRISAFRMFQCMRDQHFSNGSEEMSFEQLITAPLLLIDDLGSEPMMRNITVEYLFTLLNERMAAGRHTVVATNLSPLQFQQTYGERVASRLLDRSRCAALKFSGKDLRHL